MKYELNININQMTGEASAEEQPQVTTTEKTENPVEETKKTDKNISAKGIASGALALTTLGANIYKQNVAINSGDQNEVNKTNFIVDKGTKLATIGVAFAFNPVAGALALGGAIASEVIGYATNQIAFNRQVQDEQIAIGTYNDRRGIAYNRSGR